MSNRRKVHRAPPAGDSAGSIPSARGAVALAAKAVKAGLSPGEVTELVDCVSSLRERGAVGALAAKAVKAGLSPGEVTELVDCVSSLREHRVS